VEFLKYLEANKKFKTFGSCEGFGRYFLEGGT